MKKLFLLFLIPFLWVSCSSGDSSDSLKISLNKTSLTLTIGGKTAKLTATISPPDAPNKVILWSSSDDGIATVSKTGKVAAVAKGTAIITATSKADNTKKAKCTVSVIERSVADIGDKDGLSGKTAAEYFEEKKVYIGWNLGNGFDASAGYGSWTRKIDEDFLPKIKEAGFSMVRIPVTWNSNIGAAPDYTIDADMFSELIQVVDWAYDAGLVTIINIHHDGSALHHDGSAYGGWLSMNNLKLNRDVVTGKFIKVWEQIADKFKDYGDWLIFEPFNELHNGGWGWGDIAEVEYDIINDLNQKFTDTVREAGGKNTERFLVVQPLCAKPHQAMAETFILPTDSATRKQIVSMHYYDPESFALNGRVVEWGGESDRIRLSNDFEDYAEKFTKNGIPVILGESGATYQNRSDPAQKLIADASRFAYLSYMCSTAKENGIIPIYWDNGTIYAGGDSNPGENFGLWDRRSQGDLEVFPGLQLFINAMIEAVQD